MNVGPNPSILQYVDWAFGTVAEMQATLAAQPTSFEAGRTVFAAGRKFKIIDVAGVLSAVEDTVAEPELPGLGDIALTRLPALEGAQVLLGKKDLFTGPVIGLTMADLGFATYGTLDAGGFDMTAGDGTTLCKVRAGRGTTSASAGVAITFVPAMSACNIVLVSSRNDGADPLATVHWSNVSATGFNAHGFNSAGARIARDFTYIAIGR